MKPKQRRGRMINKKSHFLFHNEKPLEKLWDIVSDCPIKKLKDEETE